MLTNLIPFSSRCQILITKAYKRYKGPAIRTEKVWVWIPEKLEKRLDKHHFSYINLSATSEKKKKKSQCNLVGCAPYDLVEGRNVKTLQHETWWYEKLMLGMR